MLSDRIIDPETATALLGDASSVTARERAVWRARSACLRELTKAQREARDSGFEAGVSEAIRRTVSGLVTTQLRCRAAESRLVDLVFVVTRRLLGELPPDLIMPSAVHQALVALRERPQNLTLEVHPQLVAPTEKKLSTAWSDEHEAPPIDVLPNPELGFLDCRIDLGDCVVDAGLTAQLEALQQALRATGHADVAAA